MKDITTKRHPIKFYLVLILAGCICFGFGTVLLLMGLEKIQQDQPTFKEYLMPVSGIALYIITFLMIFSYWKNSPQIILTNNEIQIGDDRSNLTDIKDIILNGKMPFKFFGTHPMEGSSILFNDGTEKILFDDMYSNISEVKMFLEQVVLKKQQYNPYSIKEISQSSYEFENKETFKGNQFTSLRGISLWGLIGFFTYLLVKWKSSSLGLLIFFGAFGTFWFIFNSWLMMYFELTKDFLIIKNHNFIWWKKVYSLKDIKEVVFETHGMQPNKMRIITRDFRNNLYPAGSLRDNTWLSLKEKLEVNGISVRNECIYEE